jgi:hypothetical protein
VLFLFVMHRTGGLPRGQDLHHSTSQEPAAQRARGSSTVINRDWIPEARRSQAVPQGQIILTPPQCSASSYPPGVTSDTARASATAKMRRSARPGHVTWEVEMDNDVLLPLPTSASGQRCKTLKINIDLLLVSAYVSARLQLRDCMSIQMSWRQASRNPFEN